MKESSDHAISDFAHPKINKHVSYDVGTSHKMKRKLLKTGTNHSSSKGKLPPVLQSDKKHLFEQQSALTMQNTGSSSFTQRGAKRSEAAD